jgi:large subunit ribosomal protein L24
MKLKVGDKVRVMVGKDKGKEGKIVLTLKDTNKVLVEGLNMMKKHVKPNNTNQTGGIIEKESKIDASNVMLIDSKTKKPTRVYHEIDEKTNKKVRVSKAHNKLD